MPADDRLKELELYAWVGEDEFGSGEIGLKQGVVPAGVVPLVATSEGKVHTGSLVSQGQAIADQFRKPRYLVKFTFLAVIASIEPAEAGE